MTRDACLLLQLVVVMLVVLGVVLQLLLQQLFLQARYLELVTQCLDQFLVQVQVHRRSKCPHTGLHLGLQRQEKHGNTGRRCKSCVLPA